MSEYKHGFIPRIAMIAVSATIGIFSLVLLGIGAASLADVNSVSSAKRTVDDCSNNPTCCTSGSNCCNCVILDPTVPIDPSKNYCNTGAIGCGPPSGGGGGGGTTTKLGTLKAAGAFSIISGVFGAIVMTYILVSAIKDIEIIPSAMVWTIIEGVMTIFTLITFALWASVVDLVHSLWSLASANLAFSIVLFLMFAVTTIDVFLASRAS